MNAAHVVNDLHSQLNSTRVARVFEPVGLPALVDLVHQARRDGAQLSLCGGRHAMGGQQFGTGNWLIDLRQHRSMHDYDQDRGLVTADMLKPGAVVLDVGTSRGEDGKLVGDVDPGAVEVAGWIAPMPGGVGPMTRAMLVNNVVLAAERAAGA